MTNNARCLAELHLKSTLAKRYVRSLLARWTGFRYLRDDLEQEARRAIIRAAGKFDPSRGVPFEPYAWAWMRSYCRRYIDQNGGSAQTISIDQFKAFEEESAVARQVFERLAIDCDPSDVLDGQRVWNDVSNELQSAPLRRGSGKGYEVKRRAGEGRDFLRHAFGNVPLRTLADEQGLALTSVQSHVQRVRGEFYARYPQVADWFEDPRRPEIEDF